MLRTLSASVFGFLFVVQAVAQDTPLTMVLSNDSHWELVSEGHGFTEGPAVDRHGNVFFSDLRASKIFRADHSGKVTLFADKTAQTNGLMFGADGKLYGCRNGDRSIVAYDSDASFRVVASGVSSNDLVVSSTGDIYFTDPENEQVWYVPSGGKPRVVAKGFRPNGVVLWPDESTLVVTDSVEPHLWTFAIKKDGSLAHREAYYQPLVVAWGKNRPGSDGMAVDDLGRLFVATYAGLQMCDSTGRPSGVMLKPQRAFLSNVAFGGPDFSYLFVTCGDKVYRRKTKTKGTPYFLRQSKGN